MEIFKEIEGYSGLYAVSNYGRVKSLGNGNSNNSKERILKPAKNSDGYLVVGLYKEGKCKFYKIHRLVAQAFIPNPNNYPQVNHKDEDKTNNKVENLEWCTHFYNINYGTRNQKVAERHINNPKQSKQVLCLETGKIYPSTHQVERELGFYQQDISKCCNGKLKTCGGYTWKYV